MQQESPQQIGLPLPDYSWDYVEWLRKQESKAPEVETVVIIDIY